MRSQGKVLIVDDDPSVTAVYEVALQAERFTVAIASDGSSALRALQEFKPDVVLLDLDLPGIHGLRWLATVRAVPDFKDLPVVILTAAAVDSPEMKVALAAGVKGVLTKNQWGAESVTAAVKWALTKRPVEPEAEEPNWSRVPR